MRCGLSLVETMLSISMLAIILSSLVAGMGHVAQAQGSVSEREEAGNLLRHMLERIQTAEVTDLCASGRWSEATFWTGVDGVPQNGIGADVLIDAALLSRQTALANLEVFVEYYRGVNDSARLHISTTQNGAPGLLQWDDESDADYGTRVHTSFLDDGSLSGSYRLSSLSQLLALRDTPIVIRLIVRWGDQEDITQRSRIICATGRLADPSASTVN